MGRKGMKGFMKSASKAAGPSTADDAPEPEQQAASSSSSTAKEAAAPRTAAAVQPKAAEPSCASGFELEDPDAGPETRGHMLQRHKREMLAHKKAVQKLGKSKKDEAAKLAQRIEERHERELRELEAREAAAAENGTSASAVQQEALAAAASKYVKQVAVDDGEEGAEDGVQKRTKAQKRKEKQAARDAEREARIAAELEALGPSDREAEEKGLKALLAPLGLAIKDIRADGHCMYRSLEDQLQQHEPGGAAAHSYQELREAAAAYMRQHRDEFEPYLHDEEGAEAGDDDEDADARFERYCATMEGTAAWGGQLELKALAAALRRPIQVFAVGLGDLVLGEEFAGKAPLKVCYLRHAYGLGEHYNSVKPSALAAVADAEAAGSEHDESAPEAETEEHEQ